MSLASRIRAAFDKPAPAHRGLVEGVTPGDQSGAQASSGWAWHGGVSRPWAGDKAPGSISYPSLWSLDTYRLRQRSRVAYWDSVQARALIGRLVDNVIASGLTLESSPVWSMISPDWSEERRRDWLANTENRWMLWANSTDPDATGRLTLQQIQRLEFSSRLRDGETIPILRYSQSPNYSNPVQLQFLDPDQVGDYASATQRTAAKKADNRIVDGFELDKAGREIAIYALDEQTAKAERIPVSGPSGRRFVLHPAIIDTFGRVRGIGVLANLIHELEKITTYSVAELAAAVINASIAGWTETEAGSPKGPGFKAPSLKADSQAQAATASATSPQPQRYEINNPGLWINSTAPGQKLQSYDTKRPNVNFDVFLKAFVAQLSASLGIPVEVLTMSFNANYSASRASLLLFWTVVETWRDSSAAMFLGPIYAAWFAEEVRAGRIEAPGFGESPTLTRAWLNCDWIGINKPSIDPQKEATAADTRIAAGLTTRAREAKAYNGSEFSENVSRLAIENADLAKANKSITPAAPAPAFSASSSKQESAPNDQKPQEDEEE
jgi:lambda family phage portal protein